MRLDVDLIQSGSVIGMSKLSNWSPSNPCRSKPRLLKRLSSWPISKSASFRGVSSFGGGSACSVAIKLVYVERDQHVSLYPRCPSVVPLEGHVVYDAVLIDSFHVSLHNRVGTDTFYHNDNGRS